MWSRLGPRPMFGQFMMDLAETCDDLMVISADLGRSSGLDRFKKQHPDKYLSVGISEQNMIGVAAGLAKEGHKVFVTSFAPFLSMRASEQIRMNLGYMELGVNLVALGSGLAMGFLGNSHYGLEDIAIMRTIPNLNIHSPADSLELRSILCDICENDRKPSYIRLTGIAGAPFVYEENYVYELEGVTALRKGSDVLIISTGSIVGQCKIAADMLSIKGLEATIISLHTIKPLSNLLLEYLRKFQNIIIVEEHSKIGGLLGAIAEVMVMQGISKRVLPINLPDAFGPTGSYEFLLDYHGLTGEKISQQIESFL